MIEFIVSCFYFFLPAYAANMVPPLVRNVAFLRFLDVPVDFNRKLGGIRIFGSHKTWRGFFASMFVGAAVAVFQGWLYQFPWANELSPFDYRAVNIWTFGLLISFGAVAGDLACAAIKRRLRLEPGASFMPWDQTNYVIGSFFILEPYVRPHLENSLAVWGTLFVLTFFVHILFNRFGYDLGLHKAKW